MIDNQTKWIQENYVEVLNAVYRLVNCKQLKDYCLDSICEDPKSLFNSPNFLKLGKSILLELIKRDYLRMDEIKLWNYLIKWGIAQTTELRGKNTKNLSKVIS